MDNKHSLGLGGNQMEYTHSLRWARTHWFINLRTFLESISRHNAQRIISTGALRVRSSTVVIPSYLVNPVLQAGNNTLRCLFTLCFATLKPYNTLRDSYKWYPSHGLHVVETFPLPLPSELLTLLPNDWNKANHYNLYNASTFYFLFTMCSAFTAWGLISLHYFEGLKNRIYS